MEFMLDHGENHSIRVFQCIAVGRLVPEVVTNASSASCLGPPCGDWNP